MLVKDVMTSEVLTLDVSENLDIVDDLMKFENIRHIPVIDENQMLTGIVSHRDLLKASISSFANVKETDQKDMLRWMPVKDVMSTKVLTIEPEASVSEAAAIMLEEKIGCLVVVKNDRVVGIVTETDFVGLVARSETTTSMVQEIN